MTKSIESVVHSTDHPIRNVPHIHDLFHVRGNGYNVVQRHGVVPAGSSKIVPEGSLGHKHHPVFGFFKNLRSHDVIPPQFPQGVVRVDGNVAEIVVAGTGHDLIQFQSLLRIVNHLRDDPPSGRLEALAAVFETQLRPQDGFARVEKLLPKFLLEFVAPAGPPFGSLEFRNGHPSDRIEQTAGLHLVHEEVLFHTNAALTLV
mmetsp:Transcript_10323/g.30207  ORF Transcript_10323/g.30207 Transcript_10323/m.30207 type:complete len:202 (-) Transcript_10323:1004-1609(-)